MCDVCARARACAVCVRVNVVCVCVCLFVYNVRANDISTNLVAVARRKVSNSTNTEKTLIATTAVFAAAMVVVVVAQPLFWHCRQRAGETQCPKVGC